MEGYTYESAAKELEQILEALKNDEISIDNLATKVEKASKLIAFCKEKLSNTEKSVQVIIDKLEA
ncbi:exodeoxyribonuclease VII small subunit [Flavobacterium agricola]|uniref:Exodeoxyribonuclease VII small subunit n=1 Tax=Flavobacterium agricola TaxID=2870839 RepID=A0ABY6M484_9FLAO|nr:exodeoxyribonuclease VII small subunit [Flavobacterium agricola]UYW02383.1 exodeoxyribonuclease VII small subunit [Flavobacterium agricola]